MERLVERRLVIVDRDTIEVAHEALLREWPRLRTWLDEDVDGRRVHRHLGDTARAWRASGEDPSELYRGTRLESALEWAAAHPSHLNDTERAFVEASRTEAERETEDVRRRMAYQARANRRLRALLAGVGVLLAVALLSGWLFLRQRDRAEGAARAARARELAGTSALALERTPSSRHSSPCTPSRPPTSHSPKRSAPSSMPLQTSRLLVRAEEGSRSVDVTRDGRLLVTASSSDPTVAVVWDTATWTPLRSLAGPSWIQDLAISPDGSRLAVGYDGTDLPPDAPGLIVWNPVTGAIDGVLEAARGGLHFPSGFSPDGGLLAVTSTGVGSPGRLTVWDVDARAVRFSKEADGFGDGHVPPRRSLRPGRRAGGRARGPLLER